MLQFNLNCNKMKNKKKIQIKFIKKDNTYKRVMSIDKKSLELYAQIMRDRYGEV